MIQKVIFVNGIERNLFVSPNATLSTVIREQLGLTGTKVGCGEGQCGACSVIMDGKVIRSCVTKMSRVPERAQVTTIEGIGTVDNLHPLQRAWMKFGAAQCGFCSPGFIVSAKALLDSNLNPTREDVRDWFHKHRNVCRCTGYIPLIDSVMAAAAVMRGEKPMESLDFVMPEDKRIWGSEYPRPTAMLKVMGALDYGADLGLKMPDDTLHIALVQAEVSHANIKGIDTSEAEKMPGVVKVITHKDVKGKNRITGLITFPTNLGDGWDRPILCDEKVFQYGDAIAMVCADSYEEAVAAAAKVKVDLEPLPAYMSLFEAKDPDAIEIHPGTPNTYFTQKLKKGDDTAPIFESADCVVEESVLSSRQPHLPIEPDVGFAYFTDDGKLHIHSKSIGVHLHALMIAPGIGMDAENVVIAANPMGGTFGYKFSPTMEALVGVATMATGRPTFLRYTYRQQQQYTGKRSPFYITTKFAADKEGKLLAMHTDFDVDHGPYSEFGDLLTLRGIQFIGAGYDIANMSGEGRTVCTNHAWGSAFRGYGSPQSFLSSELLMDRLAEKLGMDPLEIRYKNVYRKGSTNNSGQVPDSYALPQMIDDLRPKYKAALEHAKAHSTDKHKKGVGLAVGSYGCGLDGPDSASAYVEMNADGTITVCTAWQDHGQGADIGAIGTAHQALFPMGIEPHKLRFTWPDSEKCPVAGPSGGSRSQVVIGQAIRVACEALLEGAKKGDGTYMSYGEMIDAGKPVKYDGTYSIPGKECDADGQGSPFMVYMYIVFMAETTTELATGKVVVDKMTAHTDIGKINNKLAVDGQMWGGIAQGIGLALSEDFEDIKKHATMAGAGIPYCKDIPDNIEVVYYQEPREYGPFGAAGVGEAPLTAGHAAILNSIKNATGAIITRIPARPADVLEALKEVK